MQPPYDITSEILHLLTSISEKLGEANALHLSKPSVHLRKRNRVKTIQASLEIEGNTLTEEQITAILEHKRVIGPQKDIQEVLNAVEVYNQLATFKPHSVKSFLNAHQILMKGLIDHPGQWRNKSVGIIKGDEITHLAPPTGNLHYLMDNLFDYIKEGKDPILIKSSVVHYEIEFIHPFLDGNGRMGRLWQTILLLREYPIFEFLPFETIIKEKQNDYYQVLAYCDKVGKSTAFIEFMLRAVLEALEELLTVSVQPLTAQERMDYFITSFEGKEFSRKDYRKVFKDISSSTASRDLKQAVEAKQLMKVGDKRLTHYRIIRKK